MLTRGRMMAVLVLALVLAGCGQDTDVDSAPETTQVPSRGIDGVWEVGELRLDNTAYDATRRLLVIELDTIDAVLSGQTECGPILGSFTLSDTTAPDGQVSFTVPSSNAGNCDLTDQTIEAALVDALESVDIWVRDGQQLRFTRSSAATPDHDLVVLTPAS